MRNLTLFLLTGILFAACTKGPKSNSVDLSDPWKFQTGDNPAWSAPGFDDASWKMVSPIDIWENQGYKNHDGFAWYRIKVIIPRSITENAFMKDSLQIKLGKIDDYDQVFLNGELIGENCRSVQPGSKPGTDFNRGPSVWNSLRRYVLPVNDPRIHWDQENVLAVRVWDQGGAGGMFAKPFSIGMVDLGDYLAFDFSATGFRFDGDTAVGKDFTLDNLSPKTEFTGIIHIMAVRCDNGNKIFEQSTETLLKPGTKSAYSINIPIERGIPAKVHVCFTEKTSGKSVSTTLELPYILTPAVAAEPRINGARVFGVRPWSPFLFRIPATGEAPLTFSADSLPEGLKLKKDEGIITGFVSKKGDYRVKLKVSNNLGTAESTLLIRCGDMISLTPPMGWNSWNVWGLSVSDKKVRLAADAFVSSSLAGHGWTYINIDDGWEDSHDKNGNIIPNYKFPDMKGMCSYVHSLGLKVGIYSSPGPKTCGGYEGSYKFEEQDAKNYADWGIDYLKYDWCSYGNIAPDPNDQQLKFPYKEMRKYIRKAPRDIHYSLCQYGMGDVWKWGHEVDGNSWRTTGDITDSWESLSGIGFSQDSCSPYAAPGRWNDPDMLVVGWVGWGPSLHYTRLSPNEQYTHISLWSLLAAPLLLGCDLTQLDPFTMNLLTNDEVLAINQDPLGKQARRVFNDPTFQIWVRELADSSRALGLFNMTEEPLPVDVRLDQLGLTGVWMMRDVWPQKDLGWVRSHFEMKVPPHGSRLVILRRK